MIAAIIPALYVIIGCVVGGFVYQQNTANCLKCHSDDRWDNCYKEHGLAASGIGFIWPLYFIARSGISLAQLPDSLKSRRETRARLAKQASDDQAAAYKAALDKLRAMGIDEDWMKL